MIGEIKMGDVRDFRNFMGAVIDQQGVRRASRPTSADAKQNAKIVAGGGANGEKGYFIEPTLVETADPGYRLLCEEIFGPVVTAYVYDDAKWEETLRARRRDLALRADRRRLRARPRARCARRRRRCATRPATST